MINRHATDCLQHKRAIGYGSKIFHLPEKRQNDLVNFRKYPLMKIKVSDQASQYEVIDVGPDLIVP